MKPVPGVDIFSKEWFDAHASNVKEPLIGVVSEICKGYQLGNTVDPNIIASMIEESLKKYILSKVRIGKKAYIITGVCFDGVQWFFLSNKTRIHPEIIEVFLSGPW